MAKARNGLVTRADFVREAQRLKAAGLVQREIAEHFGVSRSAVCGWLTDPDLSKQRERRKRYAGKCVDCGAPTDGSDGPGKAARRCKACAERPLPIVHGTRAGYQKGCACGDCRAANREYMRSLHSQEPPTHSVSGYVNYGCRCDVCREAHRKHQWMNPQYQQRWQEKVRGTEPPRHGYSVAYNNYGCRCDECRAWASETWRKSRMKARGER